MKRAFRQARTAGWAICAFLAALAVPATAARLDLPDRVQLPPKRPADRAGRPPVPSPRPDEASTAQSSPSKNEKPSAPPPEELACRARLATLGATFRTAEAVSDPIGCDVPYPLLVTGLGDGVTIAPEALLNCQTAETLALFLRDEANPDAQAALGTPIATVNQVSAYVCRARNGTEKLSEHAFGNAIDIAAFTLGDGRQVKVGAEEPESAEKAFLDRVRAAACGPFKTVLGPGADADHSGHFHFDLQKRRNGSTFCQ